MNERPVFLNLFQIRFPLTAIVSILHRISGVILFLFIPLMLWILQQSLQSATSFTALRDFFMSPMGIAILIILGVPFIYHLFAGIRHIVMDCGIGETKQTAKITAYLVLILSFVIVLWVGGLLW